MLRGSSPLASFCGNTKRVPKRLAHHISVSSRMVNFRDMNTSTQETLKSSKHVAKVVCDTVKEV